MPKDTATRVKWQQFCDLDENDYYLKVEPRAK